MGQAPKGTGPNETKIRERKNPMGRKKTNKPHRIRRKTVAETAAAYRCGHCHSETTYRIADGFGRINIAHDDGCPVLAGTVSDLPDAMRAGQATGGTVVADGSTGRTVCLLYPTGEGA